MLTAQVPQQYVDEIDCTDIHPFKTVQEATLYRNLKHKDYMIVKDSDGNGYYVMPDVNGLLVGSCYDDENN
jgi:hypothetical protein